MTILIAPVIAAVIILTLAIAFEYAYVLYTRWSENKARKITAEKGVE